MLIHPTKLIPIIEVPHANTTPTQSSVALLTRHLQPLNHEAGIVPMAWGPDRDRGIFALAECGQGQTLMILSHWDIRRFKSGE